MSREYVPAAGRKGLTGLYDPVVALTMREASWRPEIARSLVAACPPRGTILDVGAGTGSLIREVLATAGGEVAVIGVDGDEEILARARLKVPSGRVEWIHALVSKLPLGDASVDAASMTLVMHHLDTGGKVAALRELRRVIRPGGLLLIADWGIPRGLARPGFLGLRFLDGFENTAAHARGEIPGMIETEGFGEVRVAKTLTTVWGTLELWEANGM